VAGAVYDLISLVQLKQEIGKGSAASPQDGYLQGVIDAASLAIERECNRRIVYRGYPSTPYVEYATLMEYRAIIYTLEAPILAAPAIIVNEDQSRVFGSGTILTNGFDYIVDQRVGRITRTSGSYTVPWMPGIRSVQITYGAGWLGPNSSGSPTVNVPATLQRICMEMCAAAWQRSDKTLWAISGKTDSEGNFQKIVQPLLTADHMTQLDPFRRESFYSTNESDDDNTQ
jgi:hypothetical protein